MAQFHLIVSNNKLVYSIIGMSGSFFETVCKRPLDVN